MSFSQTPYELASQAAATYEGKSSEDDMDKVASKWNLSALSMIYPEDDLISARCLPGRAVVFVIDWYLLKDELI